MRCFALFVCLTAVLSSHHSAIAAPLRGRIVDAKTGKALPARLYIRSSTGQWHFARSASSEGSAVTYKKQRGNLPPSVEMHTTLSAHPFVADLPPGTYELTVERGHEYHTAVQKVAIGREPVEVTLKLTRWIDMASKKWYSGDTHVHRSLEELPNVMLAEDLNVAFPLVYWVTQAYAPPKSSAKSTKKDPPAKVVKVDSSHVYYPRNTEYEIFTVGVKRHTLGAVFVLNHQSIFERGVPPVGPIAEMAHREKALLELDKHNWPWSMALIPIMNVDLYELSNNHVWRTNFGFPGFGEKPPKFMAIEQDKRGMTERGWLDFTFKNYYTLLNCGFRLRPTAGTASGVHPVPLGFGRVYVHCKNGFSYDQWLQGLDQGNSFVTTGPMLFLTVNGKEPGTMLKQSEKKATYTIAGHAISAYPLKSLEIVVKGKAEPVKDLKTKKIANGAFQTSFELKKEISSTSWILARCFEDRPSKRPRFAHTGPVHIEAQGKAIRPRAEEIGYLIQRVESQIERSRGVLNAEAIAEYRRALKVYREIAERK